MVGQALAPRGEPLGLPGPPRNRLSTPHHITRRPIIQKVRHHPPGEGSDWLWAPGFRVCFTPILGTFHLSLTVLVHYRSHIHMEAWKVVLPCSTRKGFPVYSTSPRVGGVRGTPPLAGGGCSGALTRCGTPFQRVSHPLPRSRWRLACSAFARRYLRNLD